MYKKLLLVAAAMALTLFMGCDNTTETGSEQGVVPEAEQTAFKEFNEAYIPSGVKFTSNFYFEINGSINTELLIKLSTLDGDFWSAYIDSGLTGASQEAIEVLLELIHDEILRPWTFLEDSSIGGQYGCVSWSLGVAIDSEAVAGLYNNFWTLTVQNTFEDCPDLDGQFTTVIEGNRIGIVYKVHVTGDFTVASMPEETFRIDVVYNLEDCFNSWDCVDWEGTINGYNIGDIY